MKDDEIRNLHIEIHNLIAGISEIFEYELPEEVTADDLEEIRESLLHVLETVSYVIDKYEEQ